MLKKIFAVILLFNCFITSIGFARMTDSGDYKYNGKLEEYDRRAKEANSAGFDKRGLYIEPYHRNELATGITEEEWDKIDKGEPSYYYYKDGRPKLGNHSTAQEEKERKEIEELYRRAKEREIEENIAKEKQRRKELELQIKQNEESGKEAMMVSLSMIGSFLLLVFIMRKMSAYEENKAKEKIKK